MKPSTGIALLCLLLTPCFARADAASAVTAGEKQKWEVPTDFCVDFLKIPLEKGPTLLIGNNPEQNGDSLAIKAGGTLCVGFLKSDGTYQKLIEGGGVGGNAFDVEIVSGKNITITEQLADVRANSTFPYGETSIACDSGACAVTDTHCRLALPANPYPEIIQEAKNLTGIDWESFAAGTSMDGMNNFLNPLLIRALWGDADATQLLTNPPVQLTGDAGETWGTAVNVYTSAKRMGCLPLRLKSGSR